MTKPRTLKNLAAGDMVAMNKSRDAERFEVVSTEGMFTVTVRQPAEPHWPAGRNYAPQVIDRSMIEQHWPKGGPSPL